MKKEPIDKEKLESLTKQPEALYQELNLLRVEGYTFSFDPKNTGKDGVVLEFNEYVDNPEENIKKKPVTIAPNPLYGRPSPLAYKLLNVIFKKLSEYGVAIPNSVPFTFRELNKRMGRPSFGGKDAKEIYNALKQIQTTNITFWVFNKSQDKAKVADKWMTYSFYIFPNVIASGSVGKLEEGFVTIDPLIVKNLEHNYHRTLNYSRMNIFESNPIAIALYKQIYNVFATRKSHRQSPTFEKNYDKICSEWLGGLKVWKYKSEIIRKIGPHMDHLKSVRLLRSYKIEKNSTGGWKFIFTPGSGFQKDYDNFYMKKLQTEIQYEYLNDLQDIQEPLELVSYFYTQLYAGTDTDNVSIFSPKDTDFAKQILEDILISEAKDFVDYSLAEAVTTGFDIKTFCGIRQYLPGWPQAKEKIKKQQKKEIAKQKKEHLAQLENEYQIFRDNEIKRARKSLSFDELSSIENDVKKKIQEENNTTIGISMMVRVHTNKVISERFNIPSFDQWKEKYNT
jgi:hypothetical protein